MDISLTKEKLKNIYGKVSPFEFKDKLLQLAYLNNNKILDAGRGNPNWTAATPRQAFFTFGQFAVLETQRSLNIGDLAGMVQKDGIAKRLLDYIKSNPSLPVIKLINKKPILPSEEELKENSRSRTAKLRIIERL